jgi:hypothetical protein
LISFIKNNANENEAFAYQLANGSGSGATERARGILSCRVKEDRGLDCELAHETTAGVGAAALALASAFTVAESSEAFALRYRTQRFLLPINFGFAAQFEPVSTAISGLEPIEWPAPPWEMMQTIYPQEARAQGIEGIVELTCALGARLGTVCEVDSEQPAGWGFGQAAVENFEQALWADEDSPLMAGDRVRFEAIFSVSSR